MSKLLASLMRNYFPKRPSGEPLHTLSKLYDVPIGFVNTPPLFWGCVLLYLRSPKGGCCSISDDLPCFFLFFFLFGRKALKLSELYSLLFFIIEFCLFCNSCMWFGCLLTFSENFCIISYFSQFFVSSHSFIWFSETAWQYRLPPPEISIDCDETEAGNAFKGWILVIIFRMYIIPVLWTIWNTILKRYEEIVRLPAEPVFVI